MQEGLAPKGEPGAGLLPTGIRGNDLWGSGRTTRRLLAFASIAAALLAAVAGAAIPAPASASTAKARAYVTPSLVEDATANPDALFDVIVQGTKGHGSDAVAVDVEAARAGDPGRGGLKRKFVSIEGVAARLSGSQLLKLAEKQWIESITRDSAIELAGYSSTQVWPAAAGVTDVWSWTFPSAAYPTIAVVDSGVTALPTFESRLVESVDFTATGAPDTYGHGTFVGSIAAGADAGYAGAEPRAKLVSLRVLDGNGIGWKSDVIAACDWILENRFAYNIRVANFSLNTPGESFRYDALDRAVERLWLNGVVVVVAAGNYAVDGAQSDVGYAPANDPFVITVGASDDAGNGSRNNDFAAPWSAWGYTQDGFFKPELAAPGRRLIGTVPRDAMLPSLLPERVLAPNRMWMSGTSFAAPVVSGIAASILAKHPAWTPDQVKGALMEKAAQPSDYVLPGALGVGVVNGAAAAGAPGTANPNAGLNAFVVGSDPFRTFDASAWYAAASSNASWSSASWSSASWSSASWSSASWSSASWSSASWSSASWSSASWSSASWANGYAQE